MKTIGLRSRVHILRITTGLVLASVLLSGCSGKAGSEASGHTEKQSAQRAPNGDLWETTAGDGELPKFLSGKQETMRLIYGLAAQHTELLDWIPCYCGCGGSAGHKSNTNCFVKEKLQDGAVVWDDHGTRCDTCLEIAATALKMQQEGKTTKQIRALIEETHKMGYAKPTPTPSL